MTALIRVESGGDPLLIRDNTLARTFRPQDAKQGVVWASQLLALRHSIDIGISQINSANFAPLGLSLREAFDPCINMHAGAAILSADYRDAAHAFGPGQYALRRAIGAYNSGSLYGGYDYVSRILAAAGMAAPATVVPDLHAIAVPLGASGPLTLPPVVKARLGRGADIRAAPPSLDANPFNSSILVGGIRDEPASRTRPEESPISPEATKPPAVALRAVAPSPTPMAPIVETEVGPNTKPAAR